MFKLGIHTLTISQDFAHVLDVMDEVGLEYIDLRELWGKNIVDLSDSEIQDIKSLIKKHGVKVCCISPWVFFRMPLRKTEDEPTYGESYTQHLDKLKRAVELAKVFDTDLVRCFSFESEIAFEGNPFFGHGFDAWKVLVERFQKPVKIVEEAGVTLALESCHLTNTGTGLMVCKLIDELGSKNVKLLWDPCNSYYASGVDPYPYEYEKVKDYIVYIDIKDKVIDKRYMTNAHVLIGEGNKIYWPEILQALKEDNYKGVISLETAYTPKGGTREDGTKESLRRVRQMIDLLEGGGSGAMWE